MLNAEIFDTIPATLFERFVPFTAASHPLRWDDLYLALDFLRASYPDAVFRREPYHYADLKSQRSGLLFVEDASERLYFVFRSTP